ncbi:MAG: PAS domain S-box protein [Magnetovibrio sp.]|nr:PAS domain S-box protein [Magnetovibrio sp.]
MVGAAALAMGAFLTLLLVTYRLQKSEARATEAEQHLKAAIDNVSEGFVIFDKNERLVMFNERYRDMYPAIADKLVPGITFTDMTQALIDSKMAPECDESAKKWQQNRITQFRSEQGEFIAQYADGRWVLLRDRKLPNGGSVGIRTDITDIKTREFELLASERRQHDLVERAPVAIYVHHNQSIIYANTMTAHMLGYDSPDQLLGKSIYDLIHPDHHRLALNRYKKVTTSSAALPQIDMKFCRADGSVIYTEAQVSNIVFDGDPAQETILRDITSRRRTERALMESEMRYRTLFELAPDAMLVHDGQKILFANAAAAKLLGAPDERKLINLKLSTLVPAHADQNVLKAFTTWQDTGTEPVSLSEARFVRLDNSFFDAEIVTAPTNYHGSAVYHAVIRDVTQRKLMDATMAQNAKLASLGSMAAGLAHELSQPLNIMRFTAEGGLLKIKRGTANMVQHKKNYGLIQDQAERMGAIMDSMRIFSRKDPGPMTAFDMALSIRNIVNMMRNPFRIDGVNIEVQAPVSGVKVLGGPIQLEQVLLNLLKNARDAIVEHLMSNPDGPTGQITIKCHPRLERGDAIITVSDNGSGIAPEDLRQIFDPFFTTKEVGKGTGLGLALSHEIIVSMSGTLSAQTTTEGACFTIALPLSDKSCANDAHDVSQQSRPQPNIIPNPTNVTNDLRVLAVEDEDEAARAMADYLTEEGFLVTTASDGHAGLEAYHEFHPDIVITDIRMPGISGAELIQALRKFDAELPIIAVTGHMGETESIEPFSTSAPIQVMKKPVSLAELSRKIGAIRTN